MTMKLPAGTYYVGDLCYSISSRWDDFCERTIDGSRCLEGVFTLADGTVVATYGTAYGDGVYLDDEGREYPVDAGLIGCVLMSSIDEGVDIAGLGHQITFDSDFTVYSVDGTIHIGHIAIDTDPAPEYDDEEDDWGDSDEEDEE